MSGARSPIKGVGHYDNIYFILPESHPLECRFLWHDRATDEGAHSTTERPRAMGRLEPNGPAACHACNRCKYATEFLEGSSLSKAAAVLPYKQPQPP